MNRIIVKSQQDVKALFYEAQSWVDALEGNLIYKLPDEKPRIITLTEFIPSWASTNLTTDEMIDWLDANLKDWLIAANWTPSKSANLSKVYGLLLTGGERQ